MDDVGKLLPHLFQNQIRRSEPHMLDILVPLWPRIAGKTMAQHSQPALFEKGLLTLNTDCPTWGQQLRYMTEEIRAGINGYLGLPIVKKVRIKAVTQRGLLSPAKAASTTIVKAPALAKPPVNTDAIADPEIAAALASSYAKYFARRGR